MKCLVLSWNVFRWNCSMKIYFVNIKIMLTLLKLVDKNQIYSQKVFVGKQLNWMTLKTCISPWQIDENAEIHLANRLIPCTEKNVLPQLKAVFMIRGAEHRVSVLPIRCSIAFNATQFHLTRVLLKCRCCTHHKMGSSYGTLKIINFRSKINCYSQRSFYNNWMLSSVVHKIHTHTFMAVKRISLMKYKSCTKLVASSYALCSEYMLPNVSQHG